MNGKVMRKYIYIVLAASLLAFISCNDKNPVTPAPQPEPEKAVEPLPGVFSTGSRQVSFAPGNLVSVDGKWVVESSQAACSAAESHFAWAEDFGKAYCEANALEEGTWSTLGSAEWKYILETRTMASGAPRYSLACDLNIDGTAVSGLFIYPDDYAGIAVDESLTWNSINESGVVFLPAAGMKNASELSGEGIYGRYWASDRLNPAIAYNIAFGPSGVSAFNAFGTYALYSVRLVCTK